MDIETNVLEEGATDPLTSDDNIELTVERYPALYFGSEPLSGIEPNSDGFVPGEYWQSENLFLFQPTGSTKIFEVSDEDIRRVSVATSGSSN